MVSVCGQTSNNALWDEHLQQYIAFSRIDSNTPPQYGTRREARSTSAVFGVRRNRSAF